MEVLLGRWNMRVLAKILKWLGFGIVGLFTLGFLLQLVGNAFDAKYAPPASDMIGVDNHAVHFVCLGRGTRTYLLDSGAGVGAFEWEYLVPLLSNSGRVCSFDRPGLGWSDDWVEAHDVSTLVRQIASIVRAAKISRPFIYVGHSLGANDAMVYRDKYKRDVAAMILIEPGRPKDLLEDFHGTRDQAMRVTDCGFSCAAVEAAAWLGVMRLATRIVGAGGHTLNSQMRGEYLAQLARPSQAKAVFATLSSLPKSAYEVEEVKSFDNTPVLILTSSDPRKRDSDEREAEFKQWRVDQLAYFTAVARMSSHGMGPVIIPNSNHATMVMSKNGSKAVTKAVMDFLGRSVEP